jgi:hypothetical protein
METKWIPTSTNIDAYDSQGKPMHLEKVPALKNTQTGKICVDASDVARAEFELLAKEYELEPRDLALLLMLHAKPGPFTGEIYCKYNLNKMLFYQWKNMEKQYGLGEAFPHDSFRPAKKGPIPINLWDDLKRLEKTQLVALSYYKWGKTKSDASLTTKLTEKGQGLVEELLKKVPKELQKVTQSTKEQIFPLDPKTVMTKVHTEYPEYASQYTEEDTE